jgi:hypothetical protein
MRNAHNILYVKHQRKRPLGRPSNRLEDNIKIDIRETDYHCVEQVHLSQDGVQGPVLVTMVISLRV